MKKFIATILTVVIAATICACNNRTQQNDEKISTDSNPSTTAENTEGIDVSSDEAETEDPVKLTEITTLEFNELRAYYDDVIYFKTGSKEGIINNKGELLYESTYKQWIPLSNHLITGFNSGWELITYTGEVLISSDEQLRSISRIDDKFLMLAMDIGAIYLQYFIYDIEQQRVMENIDLSRFRTIDSTETCGGGLQITGESAEDGQLLYCICSLSREEAIYLDGPFVLGGYGVDESGNLVDAKGDLVMNLDQTDYFAAKQQSVSMSSHYSKADLIPVWKNGKLVLIDKNGAVALEGEYNPTNVYNVFPTNDLIHLREGGYHGIIDHEGNVVIPFVYDDIEYFNGYFVAKMNDVRTFFDQAGNKTGELNIKLNGTSDAFVYEQSKTYYIADAETATIKEYTDVSAVKYKNFVGTYRSSYDYKYTGIYIVTDASGKCAIATGKETLTEFVYEDISFSDDGKLIVAKSGNSYTIYRVEVFS